MKKVIFIGSVSYSGSTLLDMMLANDPHGFSCGEVQALFQPWRPHHLQPSCGCGDSTCTLWQNVRRAGKHRLYHTLFSHFPEVNFIVDSSKNPTWIHEQTVRLQHQNMDVQHVLIWKTPLDSAASFQKRNRLALWEKHWINYHRSYFTSIDHWISISYRELIHDSTRFAQLCHQLDIPYFEGKHRYWEKTHHTLFGNTSAKIHLYAPQTATYETAKVELTQHTHPAQMAHQQIYYPDIHDRALVEFVRRAQNRNPRFSDIIRVLQHPQPVPLSHLAPLRFSRGEMVARQVKQALFRTLFRLRHPLS